MKKAISFLLCLLLLLPLFSCRNEESSDNSMPTVLDPTEYALYTNIFYNGQGGSYVGKSVTKVGIFTVITDSFHQCTRYYVWGYNDRTKCCDWQWEFIPAEVSTLPPQGSLIEVTGTFSASEAALDGYYITDASVRVKTAYQPENCDLRLFTMSDTLERVQILNVRHSPSEYEGRTVIAYGRIAGIGKIEDPYYDGSWEQAFSSEDPLPAIGTMVLLRGTFKGGVIADCTVTPTTDY